MTTMGKRKIVLCAEKLQRKEVCVGRQGVFQEIEKLAEIYGNEGMLLVVCFIF